MPSETLPPSSPIGSEPSSGSRERSSTVDLSEQESSEAETETHSESGQDHESEDMDVDEQTDDEEEGDRESGGLDLTGIQLVLPFDTDSYSAEEGLQKARALIENLDVLLRPRNFDENGKEKLKAWQKDLETVKGQIASSVEFVIAIVGRTGSGKSSMVNALLHMDNLVPTSSLRGCTSVVTEIAYNATGDDNIHAEIEFLAAEEWRTELEHLHHELIDENGNCRPYEDEAKAAWDKIHSVYPLLEYDSEDDLSIASKTVDELMEYGIAATHLGRIIKIIAPTTDEFGEQVRPYIDSKERDRGKKRKNGDEDAESEEADPEQEFWALIKRVKIYVKADALSSGAVVVDLPGTADSNQARGRIAKEYLIKAAAIWICTPQIRAVDDQVASNLLNEGFKRQLHMDGSINRLTIIATWSDNLMAGEVIKSIPSLKKTLAHIEIELKEGKEIKERNEQAIKMAKAEMAQADHRLKAAQHDFIEWQERLDCKQTGKVFVSQAAKVAQAKKVAKLAAAAKKSKGRGDATSKSHASSEGAHTSQDLLNVRGVRGLSLSAVVIPKEEDAPSSSTDRKRRRVAPDSVAAMVQPVESDAARRADTEQEGRPCETVKDEADGMDEAEIKMIVEKKAGDLQDLQAAKEAKKNIYNSCLVAATETEETLSGLRREKIRQCALARISYTRETLQEDFRRGLQLLDNEAANIINRDYDSIVLPVFCASSREFAKLESLASGEGEAQIFADPDETGIPSLRQHCHDLTREPRFAHAYQILNALNALVCRVRLFLNDENGVQDAKAVRTAFETQLPKARRDLIELGLRTKAHMRELFRTDIKPHIYSGAKNAAELGTKTLEQHDGLRWNTYRCTMRRDGVFKQNFNSDIAVLFMKKMSAEWSSTFSDSSQFSLAEYELECLKIIGEMAEKLVELSSPSSRTQIRHVARATAEQLQKSLKLLIKKIVTEINTEQSEASRSLEAVIQKHLAPAYRDGAADRGQGTLHRMKGIMNDFIEKEGFSDVADKLMGKLYEIASKIAERLEVNVDTVMDATVENFSTLWQTLSNLDDRAKQLRKQVLAAVQQEKEKIESVLETALEKPPTYYDVEHDGSDEDDEEDEDEGDEEDGIVEDE